MPNEKLTPEAAQEGSDLPEPTHSETRPRQAGDAVPERAHRTSVRPSAFGLPRASYSSPPAPAAEPRGATPVTAAPRPTPAPAHAPSVAIAPSERRAAGVDPDADESETRPSRRLQNERSRVIDQLTAEANSGEAAPASARPSTPPPPREAQPTPVASQAPAHARPRRPWASVALFGAMLALSVVPLLRYALSREAPETTQPTRALRGEQQASVVGAGTATRSAPASSTPPGAAAPDVGRDQQLITLIAAGNRALEEGAISDAERLFGRVVELDEDNPRAAYGLARVRLTQGNLSGAEGWIQLALRKRPRRRAYHALYAEVLVRLGRTDEAREEERHAALHEIDDEPASSPAADAQ